jgi:hypothetical protein
MMSFNSHVEQTTNEKEEKSKIGAQKIREGTIVFHGHQ